MFSFCLVWLDSFLGGSVWFIRRIPPCICHFVLVGSLDQLACQRLQKDDFIILSFVCFFAVICLR